MRLVKPSYQIQGNICAIDILQSIERAGRVCYKSEDKNPNLDFEKTKKFVKGIISRGHEAVLEHEKLTVKFVCDRGISHELVRHRIASFCQESTRYCDYDAGHVTFIIPHWVDIKEGEYSEETILNMQINKSPFSCGDYCWFLSVAKDELLYKRLRKEGWIPGQARSVLPNSLKTEIFVTANIREWRHIFNLRAIDKTGAAHSQMKELMIPLLEDVKKMIPVLFDDLVIKG